MKRNTKIISGVVLLVIVIILAFLLLEVLNTNVLETTVLGTRLYTMNADSFDSLLLIAMFSTALCGIGALVMIISGLRNRD
jgi:hypothetical protein